MTRMSINKRLDELYALEKKRLLEQPHMKTGDYEHPVFGQGNTPARLMLLGEAPGAEEAKSGRPFVGKAGKQLDELLQGAGIERASVFVTNAVKFRPTNEKARSVSNRTPCRAEIEAGLALLKNELDIIAPEIIATLGNTPLFAMLNLAGMGAATIGSVHGKSLPILVDGKKYLLFPLYHPASAIYNRALLPVMEADIRALGVLFKEEG